MDAIGTILTAEIVKALSDGQLTKFAGYCAIFFLLWNQLRGLKKEVMKLNSTISEGFVKGEARFLKIEEQQLKFEHRLTMIEPTGRIINEQTV